MVSRWVMTGVGGCGIVASILMSIQRFLEVDAKSHDHAAMADAFRSLSKELETAIVLPSITFANPDEAIKYYRARMMAMMERAPSVPLGILRRHREHAAIVSDSNSTTEGSSMSIDIASSSSHGP